MVKRRSSIKAFIKRITTIKWLTRIKRVVKLRSFGIDRRSGKEIVLRNFHMDQVGCIT
jgi:hypothetical protein